MAMAKEAPTGVKIIGWLALIAGLLGILGSISSFVLVPTLPPEAAALYSLPQTVLGLIISAAIAAGGFYLLKLRKLGWQLLVAALVISILNNIWTAVAVPLIGVMAAIPGIIISLLIIWYLWTKKALFK